MLTDVVIAEPGTVLSSMPGELAFVIGGELGHYTDREPMHDAELVEVVPLRQGRAGDDTPWATLVMARRSSTLVGTNSRP